MKLFFALQKAKEKNYNETVLRSAKGQGNKLQGNKLVGYTMKLI